MLCLNKIKHGMVIGIFKTKLNQTNENENA